MDTGFLNGNLEIYDSFLKTTEGLRNLKEITGDLRIHANVNLKNLDGFNNLTTINGDLEIYSAKLKNLDSLASLKHVEGKIHITVNPNNISSDDVRNLVLQLDDYQEKVTYNEVSDVNSFLHQKC